MYIPLNPTNQYILRFFLFITWLLPFVTKAAGQANSHMATLPTAMDPTWYPYPRSIQLRTGGMVHKDMDRHTTDTIQPASNEKPLIVIPTTIDIDILYVNAFFATQLESYPRIGLSFFMPYGFHKGKQVRFPSIWGILAYMELYQTHPTLSTWGNRISMGAIKGSICTQKKDQPNYSFLSIEEVTYHWACTPSWQLNLCMGLLINGWPNKGQHRSKQHQTNETDQLHGNRQPFRELDNASIIFKLAPIVTIGIRYVIHTQPFWKLVDRPIHYRKRKSSRVDCSIGGSSRYLPSTKKYHLIFRGSSLFSFAINHNNALLSSIELGYSWYKKALLTNMLAGGGVEATALLGYEIRYGCCLLQLQLGCAITESKKPAIQIPNKGGLSNLLKKRGSFSINLQYMLTERFFVGISARSQEIPGLRLGLSW